MTQHSDTEAWRTYPYRSGDLTFPDDEGWHPDDPNGWWYLILHLADEDGNRILAFTSFVSGANEHLGSIADPSRKKHLNQYTTGEIVAATDHLEVAFRKEGSPTNFLRQIPGEPFHYVYCYRLEGYRLELELRSQKPPYALGETGLVQQLQSTYSYYYVQPRISVTGTMVRDDGSSTRVSGIGWIDRQWYPSSNPPMELGGYLGHFWTAIHLNDGTDISAYRLMSVNGPSPFPLFEVMGPDNAYTHYTSHTIEPLEHFRTAPIGQRTIKEFLFPLSAKIVHPATGTDLTLRIEAEDPMDNAIDLGQKGCFFEGGFRASGTHQGKETDGDAFVEVAGFGAHKEPPDMEELMQLAKETEDVKRD